ncbi:HAD family hydrolase [Pseudidiomarina gelatinasegens]|uniref:phosphoserine phosphatase n=1 Tax=Pseudidiomarina gelatinasegens TaxID=2487740 RepID=A0A443YVK9_9GAMM|nr:HAD-IB family phosphatase [Pseudidiomarina gelatinasegens]RWU07970.1 HAD family hydrolase [Pseudidiomarina gelatinasegens]
MKIPRIWFFDMEGTILRKDHELDNGKVAPSAWTVLAKKLGEDCYREEEATKDKWLRGEYKGYLDWMKETVLIHKKYGLTKDHLNQLVDNAEFHDGVDELFSWLREHGVITALITGGFKALADKVQRRLKIDHALSGCEYFFDDAGKIEFFNLLPADHEGKLSFMNQVLFEHGLSADDCVFIGDGKNDVFLAEKSKISIAFNAQDELVRMATFSLTHERGKENLRDIINFFR